MASSVTYYIYQCGTYNYEENKPPEYYEIGSEIVTKLPMDQYSKVRCLKYSDDIKYLVAHR